MATGARTQLREELGPEFADIDLRSLNPRTAITQALLGDDIGPDALEPRAAWQRALLGDPARGGRPGPTGSRADGPTDAGDKPVEPSARSTRPAERPLGRGEAAPFDADAT